MDYSKLQEAVKDYILKWFQSHDDPRFTYHNLLHTREVVDAVSKMAAYYKLNDRDSFIVQTAAWFHDIAFQESPDGHELKGAQRAGLFLKDQGVDEPTIHAVEGCILATKLPQKPTGLLQQIICDADLFHLGKDDFALKCKLLRKEEEARTHQKVDKLQWRINTLQFVQKHHFFTEYGQQHLEKSERKNIKELKNRIGVPEIHPAPVMISEPEHPAVTGFVDQEKRKSKKKGAAEKGIELMFRISSTNNLRLSNMADNKAHIMITVNSIIVSVLLSVLVRKIDEFGYLTIPVLLLLVINLLTIFFSVLATRPNLPQGRFTQSDIDEKIANLLFFGNYYRMSFDDYSEGMTKVMEDQEFLYSSLKRDIYQQGIVLSRKYRMLRIAYSVFMYGLVVSVILFFIAARFH